MNYISFFSICARHDFLGVNPDPQLSIVPAPGTQKLMDNLRLKYVLKPMKVIVLRPVLDDQNTPLIEISENTIFIFEIRMISNSLPLVTDFESVSLMDIIKGRQYLSYKNSDGSNDQDKLIITDPYRPQNHDWFHVEEPVSEDVFYLKGSALKGLQPADFVISGLEGIENPVNYSEEEKKLIIKTASSKRGEVFSVTYRTCQFMPDVYGLINISITRALAGPVEYNFNLKEQSYKWHYYLIFNEEPFNKNISCEHKIETEHDCFSFFALDGAGESTFENELTKKYSGKTIIKAESIKEIKASESPFVKIILSIKELSDSPERKIILKEPPIISKRISILNLTN